MTYAPLDDQFDDHPKFLEFTLAEMGLMATAITYATRNLTDGRIPRVWPERRFGREGTRAAKSLVEVRGAWLRRPDGDFEIVGFLDHNPSKAEVLARRNRRITPAMRAAVLSRDGLVCQLCGESVDAGDVHIDHAIAVAKGGATTLDNLQVAHSVCNMRKGAN